MFSINQGFGSNHLLTQGFGIDDNPLPVSELIAQNILTTVQTVTTANDYNYTLMAARHTRGGDPANHLAAYIVQSNIREATDAPYNTKQWYLTFEIGVYIIPEQSDTTPIDTYCNVVKADIEQALMVDRYRGGNALDTQIRAGYTVTDEGLQYDIVVVNCEVNYRTAEINPYQNAR